MSDVSVIKFIPFLSFLFFLALQSLFPRRALANSGWQRIVHNAALFLINSVLLKLLLPLTLVSASLWAAEQGVGLFNWIQIPAWVAGVICVVLLDLSIYGQHVFTHKVPMLWRFHKVHHADIDMDVSTSIRFHPIELALSLVYKTVVIIALGASVSAVIVFELLLFVGPAFNHSNAKLPDSVDRALRWVIATPDTHRAHHSTIMAEQNTNYGFFLIWWDKLFNTYTESPKGGHQTMPIGLLAEADQCDRVDQMLSVPFR